MEEERFDLDGGAFNDDGDEYDDPEEYDDDDEKIDDYAAQNDGIDNSAKNKTQNDDKGEDENLEINQFEDFTTITTVSKNTNKKRTSGYPIVSFTEEAKIFSSLVEYLSKTKIDVAPGLEKEEIYQSGDIFAISRFWIANRKKYPLPLGIDRHILGKTFEKIDPNKMVFVSDLYFHDENHDEHRFDWNFNDKPYKNIC